MKQEAIKLSRVVYIIDNKNSLLSESMIRRLGGVEKDNEKRVEQIFSCIGKGKGRSVEYDELKKLLAFISYKESFPDLNNFEITAKFNNQLRDISIDELIKVFIKQKNKSNLKLRDILLSLSEENSDSLLVKYIETICINREKIETRKREEKQLKDKHEEWFDKYKNKTIKYLNPDNINENTLMIIDNIRKDKFSENMDLNSKLLSEYKEIFIKLEESLLNIEFNSSSLESVCSDSIIRFFTEITETINGQFSEIKRLKEQLDYTQIIESIKPIEEKLKNYVDTERLENENEENPFAGVKNVKEDAFNCLEELLMFFNSKDGKILDDIFKRNQTMLKLFNILISIDLLKDGEHVFLRDFNVDEIIVFDDKMTSFKLEHRIFYPGFNYYFNEHLINDIYSELKNLDLETQKKLISYAEKIIPYIEVGLDSNLSDVYKYAIDSGNANAVKALTNNLNNFDSDNLRLLTEGNYSDEIVLSSIDLLKDLDLKGYYRHIYNGNYNTLKTLYQDGINTLQEESYTLEMNFCINGKNSVESSRVMFEESKKNHTNSEKYKLRFLVVAALYKNEHVLLDNIEFLKQQSPELNEINDLLAYCLINKLFSIFKMIFDSSKYNMNQIFIQFYKFSLDYPNDVSIWNFIFTDVFKDLDVNEEINLENDFKWLENAELPKEMSLDKMKKPSIASYVGERFFPKGIKNFNYYSFGNYNLVFLDKLRRESKIYRREFEAIYRIINSDMILKTENDINTNEVYFEVICINKGMDNLKASCRIRHNNLGVEVLLLKANPNIGLPGGACITESQYRAFESLKKMESNTDIDYLLHLIQKQEIVKIEEFIDGGVNLNESNFDGTFPLLLAANFPNKEIIKLLLKNDANPNQKTFILNMDYKVPVDILSPVFSAVRSNNLEITKLLVEYGANIYEPEMDGYTLLMSSAESNRKEILQYLIEKKVDLNAKRNDGANALSLASEVGNYDIVKSLVKNGADVNINRNDGFTPLMIAAQFKRESIVKLLLENGADCNIKSNKPQLSTALLLASMSGSKESVEYLLAANVEINHKGMNGFSALHLAAEMGHTNIVKLLLKRGISIEIKAVNGITPLISAIQSGALKTVKFLIDNDANYNIKTSLGHSPLLIAKYCYNNNMGQRLKEQDDMQKNQYGKSYGFSRGNSTFDYEGILKYLVAIGAKG